ncbi:hypothetical protein FAIPA1_620011 [Frankia sp. AiPs1]|uniref:DUF3099 domain-containing protein n=1 Tax=Frankia sp. AiPa1 TaxID=573492 RepID=UPI00202B851B|nr:DUF3099 domain-containing protein [Frankia sp. AiPa1]MCL9759394.1 DUF3099 domain-containing protein [Frankia sp. AiPa1]
MRLRQERSVLITSAGRSRQSDIHRRELRYLASMAFRVVCFLLAVLVFHGWLRYLGVGVAVVLPWVAVVVANGGPTPERDKPELFDPVRVVEEAPPALEAAAHQVVDSDGWVDESGWVHAGPAAPAAGSAGSAGSAGPAGER